jgi:hypothetical protein
VTSDEAELQIEVDSLSLALSEVHLDRRDREHEIERVHAASADVLPDMIQAERRVGVEEVNITVIAALEPIVTGRADQRV